VQLMVDWWDWQLGLKWDGQLVQTWELWLAERLVLQMGGLIL
jgi:hypothetical protein